MAQWLKSLPASPMTRSSSPVLPWRKTSSEGCPLTLGLPQVHFGARPSLPPVNVIKLKILKNKAKELDKGKEQDHLEPSWQANLTLQQGTEGAPPLPHLHLTCEEEAKGALSYFG